MCGAIPLGFSAATGTPLRKVAPAMLGGLAGLAATQIGQKKAATPAGNATGR